MPEQKLNRLQMQLLLQSRIQMLPDSELRKLIHPSISQVILTVGYSVLHETLTLSLDMIHRRSPYEGHLSLTVEYHAVAL